MKKPKAIVFDYGGTLLQSDYFEPIKGSMALLKYANNPLGVSAETIQSYADGILNDIGVNEGPLLFQIDSKALTRLIYEAHQVSFDLSYQELDCIFLDNAEGVSEIEGLKALLDYLKGMDIRLAVLSNTGFCEESHRYQLRKFGLEDYFEFFIATSDYLIRKPDKRIFDVALAKLDLPCEEVWYVGNKLEYDVMGAYNAALYPVWFNPFNEKPHNDVDHLNISHYDDLVNRLKAEW